MTALDADTMPTDSLQDSVARPSFRAKTFDWPPMSCTFSPKLATAALREGDSLCHAQSEKADLKSLWG